MIYRGSLTEFNGLTVLSSDRCTCIFCPEDPFTCTRCGQGVEYGWTQCPHPRPEQRRSIVLQPDEGDPVRLIHVRPGSLHHSVNCSP